MLIVYLTQQESANLALIAVVRLSVIGDSSFREVKQHIEMLCRYPNITLNARCFLAFKSLQRYFEVVSSSLIFSRNGIICFRLSNGTHLLHISFSRICIRSPCCFFFTREKSTNRRLRRLPEFPCGDAVTTTTH